MGEQLESSPLRYQRVPACLEVATAMEQRSLHAQICGQLSTRSKKIAPQRAVLLQQTQASQGNLNTGARLYTVLTWGFIG